MNVVDALMEQQQDPYKKEKKKKISFFFTHLMVGLSYWSIIVNCSLPVIDQRLVIVYIIL